MPIIFHQTPYTKTEKCCGFWEQFLTQKYNLQPLQRFSNEDTTRRSANEFSRALRCNLNSAVLPVPFVNNGPHHALSGISADPRDFRCSWSTLRCTLPMKGNLMTSLPGMCARSEVLSGLWLVLPHLYNLHIGIYVLPLLSLKITNFISYKNNISWGNWWKYAPHYFNQSNSNNSQI